ncbi:MAG: flagellar motor protein MotB [Rhodospirillaceae bacterium]|jgi:chemotaxis protein MotB|nr:flagellar motor protein MotB [Rhodospirillaceae bacterium]MBT7957321.1 flagellar motor protein MotB [Rhodospirillaceae bacterium]
MSVPPAPQQEEASEDWLVTYADAITLLMAFFVLFFSFSKVDLEIYDQVAAGLNENMASKERKDDKNELEEDLRDILIQEGAEEAVKVGTDADGSITLELDGGAFFKPGSADLTDQAVPVLKSIHEELASPIYQSFNISIEGHTDDDPINSLKFPSNWELSSGRASTVVRFMITEGMRNTRLKATGFADTRPKFPNRDAQGAPLIDNMIANRRVVLRINRKPIYQVVKIPKFRRKKGDDKKTKSIK